MILYCDLDVKLVKRLGEKYPWPRPPWCPRCRSPRLWGHGYVRRYFDDFAQALCLKRYRCPDCGAVHTLRPQLYDRRFQVIWFTVFLSLLKKITLGRWLAGYHLNERQARAVALVKINGQITNSAYQQATGSSRPTAIRDLAELVAKGVFLRRGSARGAYYVLPRKRLTNDSNDSSDGIG